MFIVKVGCSTGIFLNTANLICRSTDISICFRGSLRLRDNESRLYINFVKNDNLRRLLSRAVCISNLIILHHITHISNLSHMLLDCISWAFSVLSISIVNQERYFHFLAYCCI